MHNAECTIKNAEVAPSAILSSNAANARRKPRRLHPKLHPLPTNPRWQTPGRYKINLLTNRRWFLSNLNSDQIAVFRALQLQPAGDFSMKINKHTQIPNILVYGVLGVCSCVAWFPFY